MKIMYNNKKKAITNSKNTHDAERGWKGFGRCLWVEYRDVKRDAITNDCRNLCSPLSNRLLVNDISKGSRNDGSRKIILIFNDSHRKGSFSPSSSGYDLGVSSRMANGMKDTKYANTHPVGLWMLRIVSAWIDHRCRNWRPSLCSLSL